MPRLLAEIRRLEGVKKVMVTNFNERLLRQTEPYAFQRSRIGAHNAAPRPAQPNTSQPNQITRTFGSTTQEYWGNVYKGYLKRREGGAISPFQLRDLAASITNLAFGRGK